jgi:uncharacterized protein
MQTSVIVMAKAPVAGYAKTRLMPALGSAGAAALARRLLQHAVTQALMADVGLVNLCCAPDAAHPAFRDLFASHAFQGLLRSDQGTGDLGARMHRAFEQALGHADRPSVGALMIGTDAPALDALVLQEAAVALRTVDVVLVPALDGGYALIGLRQPQPSLFEGMVWSTPDVMHHTRERLHRAGLHHAELAPVADIDEPADLVHVPSDWALGIDSQTTVRASHP